MTKRIVIDAGHGGKDPGAVNNSKHEAIAALAIAKKVGTLLKEKGYTVKYTRSTDKYLSLSERCKISNQFDADAFISIHLNAAANKEASGIETWRYANVGDTTRTLAKEVQTELIAATGARDRGVKTSTTFYVLKHTKAPAVLVEAGFISNNEEAKLLFATKYQSKIANAIVKGIEKTFVG